MWIRNFNKFYPDVSAAELWKTMVDVNNWPTWHGDLEYCKLDGAFEVGNHFILKPKNVGAVKILLTEVRPGQSFTDLTHFFGAKMFDTHTIEKKDGGVVLTNKLVVQGPLKWLWVKLVAQGVADTISAENDALVALVKSRVA